MRLYATAFGTFAGKGGIIHHTNPESEDQRYRILEVHDDDVQGFADRNIAVTEDKLTAEQRKAYGLGKAGEKEPTERLPGATVGEVSEAIRKSGGDGTVLDTLQNRNHPIPPLANGPGTVRTPGEDEDGDERPKVNAKMAVAKLEEIAAAEGADLTGCTNGDQRVERIEQNRKALDDNAAPGA